MACPQLREEAERMLAVMLMSRSLQQDDSGLGREEEWEADDANEEGRSGDGQRQNVGAAGQDGASRLAPARVGRFDLLSNQQSRGRLANAGATLEHTVFGHLSSI